MKATLLIDTDGDGSYDLDDLDDDNDGLIDMEERKIRRLDCISAHKSWQLLK